MKIRSARKKSVSAPKPSDNQSIFEKDVNKISSPIELIDTEIISSDSSQLSSGRIDISISSLNEKMISEGFENIELVVEEKPESKLPKKASSADIDRIFNRDRQEKKPLDEKKITLDMSKGIDKKKLGELVTDSVIEAENDEGLELEFVKSSNVTLDSPRINDEFVAAKSSQSDKTGVLEIRLGKNNETFADKKIDEISSFTSDLNTGRATNQPREQRDLFNVSKDRGNVEPTSPKKSKLLQTLESPTTNNGNKRTPSLIKRSELKDSVVGLQKNVQKPLIKSLKTSKKNRVVTERITLDLPGPSSSIAVRMVNEKTGQVVKKPIKPRRLKTIPYRKVYPFKSDQALPKIDVSQISKSQVIVSLSNIAESYNSLSVYRRNISSRPYEDAYELVNTISDPPESFTFIDDVESAAAYKYVCVPDDLPLFSFSIFKNSDYKFENVLEPFAFAFQNDQNVDIFLSGIPSFCRKLFVFRKSSAEDEKVLVDSLTFYGRGLNNVKLVDSPSPIEQAIEYSFVWIDENGIENQFEEKPVVAYTAKLGFEQANITRFSADYNKDTGEVDVKGEAVVENIFIASSDSELKNPSETTLKAAARGQNIVKIQIRRINLRTEEDEFILREIINPGISKFNTELQALNRIKFSFSDSGENAATFGYTPLFDNTDYVYIARIIVYPLGLELRKVSDFEKIEGIRAPGRLKYQFDPAIFDHPLNTELGILPASTGAKSFHSADLIGQTTNALSRRVKVLQSDIEDSITFESKIELDSAFDSVVKISGIIPQGLVDDLDHLAIEMSYDTIRQKDIIDRIYLVGSNFTYYDYSFDDLGCNSVSYTLIGIGKDFEETFRSEPTQILLSDPKLKRDKNRKITMGNYRERKIVEENKAKRKTEPVVRSRNARNG